eukprot:gene17703-23294_t
MIDCNGRTALMIASTLNIPQACTILISHGANVNYQDLDGNTALHLAYIYGNTQIIGLLESKGYLADEIVNDNINEESTSELVPSAEPTRRSYTHHPSRERKFTEKPSKVLYTSDRIGTPYPNQYERVIPHPTANPNKHRRTRNPQDFSYKY